MLAIRNFHCSDGFTPEIFAMQHNFHSHNEKIYGSLIQVGFQSCQKALKYHLQFKMNDNELQVKKKSNQPKKTKPKTPLQMHMECKSNALQATAKVFTCPQRDLSAQLLEKH